MSSTIFNQNGNGQANIINVTQSGLHVFAFGGDDIVTALADNVRVNGGLGNDTLIFYGNGGVGFGGEGNDTIIGSATAGHTTKARGGEGNDLFMFNSVSFKGDGPAATIRVSDFGNGADKLGLIGPGSYQIVQTWEDVDNNGVPDLVIRFFDEANPIIGDDELNIPQQIAQEFALMGYTGPLLTSSDFLF